MRRLPKFEHDVMLVKAVSGEKWVYPSNNIYFNMHKNWSKARLWHLPKSLSLLDTSAKIQIIQTGVHYASLKFLSTACI